MPEFEVYRITDDSKGWESREALGTYETAETADAVEALGSPDGATYVVAVLPNGPREEWVWPPDDGPRLKSNPRR